MTESVDVTEESDSWGSGLDEAVTRPAESVVWIETEEGESVVYDRDGSDSACIRSSVSITVDDVDGREWSA